MVLLVSLIWNSVSPWWSFACLGLGILYGWFFYRRQNYSNVLVSYLLAGCRAIAVALISLLILSPLLKSLTRHPQKPLILIAQDNSSSISLFKSQGFNEQQFMRQLAGLRNTLGDDYDVREFHFDKRLTSGLSTRFDGKETDIAAALQTLNERFVNQNVGAVVLATDGIFTRGSGPQYVSQSLKAPVYTIALGDTVAKRDLIIGNVNYNKTAFLGDDFEVQVLVEAYQSRGGRLHLNAAEDGDPVTTQEVDISSDNFHKVIPLRLHANKKGLHKYTFTLPPAAGEISVTNNTETIFVEVLDNKQKILLLYNSAHPDISAIKASLEVNRNYEVKPIRFGDFSADKLKDYNLAILYQLPAAGANLSQAFKNELLKLKMPVWYIVGAQTDLQDLNNVQDLVKVTGGRSDIQEVFSSFKTDFANFTLSDSTRRLLPGFPPLIAPYGNYETTSAQSVLLTQKIGHIETNNPLLAFGENNGIRSAILTAEGIWKWRLQNTSTTGNNHPMEELLGQTVQYLTTNGDRTRFRVYAAKNVFDESEDVLFNGELYNESLELINTPDVKLELKGAKGKAYSFLLTRMGKSYQLNAGMLPPDDYVFQANTQIGDKKLAASGQLVVKALNSEARQSAADHRLLSMIAKETGGKKVNPDQVGTLADLIRKNEDIKTVVFSDETFHDLVDQKWLFFLVISFLGLEWFLRKREGDV